MGNNAHQISRELLGKIVDEVFDGAIEDASVIEQIYAAIKRHETPPPQDQKLELLRRSGKGFAPTLAGKMAVERLKGEAR